MIDCFKCKYYKKENEYCTAFSCVELHKLKQQQQPILIGGMQAHQSVKQDGICTCLSAAMGMGGGYIPMIIERKL